MFVQVVKLWPPEHLANKETALTEWTEESLAYFEAHKSDDLQLNSLLVCIGKS